MKEISSLQHPIVKHLVKLRQNRDYRYDHHRIVVEGKKVIAELANTTHFHTVMVHCTSLLPEHLKTDQLFLVNEEIIKKIAGTNSPEGIIAELPMPPTTPLANKRYLLALDGVNDPGNLGTLLRTALALGWEGAFIINESCDPYNEKALRAARGATFRLPLSFGSWNQLHELIQQEKLTPLVADIGGVPLDDLNASNQKLLLVLGNEAVGVSEQARNCCQRITIPMPGEMESLNVAIAGGIMMYALKMTRRS